MSECFLNGHKTHAAQMDNQKADTRHGTVVSYDPVNSAVKVLIQPEGVLSGWIEVGHAAAGGTVLMVGPLPGDQVILQPQEGDGEHWTITHRLFSTTTLPPTMPGTGQPIQAGEVGVFQAATGNFLHFANNGTVFTAGTWHHTGSFSATGEITAGVGGSDSVTLQQHDHQVKNVGGGTGTITTTVPVAGT